MTKYQPCSSYTGSICLDGFPLSGSIACSGGNGCHECGRHSDKLPACQNEELGAPWLDESGKPWMHHRPSPTSRPCFDPVEWPKGKGFATLKR